MISSRDISFDDISSDIYFLNYNFASKKYCNNDYWLLKYESFFVNLSFSFNE